MNAAKRMAPHLFMRIRAQCQWASTEVDLDEHCAGIVLVCVKAWERGSRDRRA